MFLGGPMGPIHPVWALAATSINPEIWEPGNPAILRSGNLEIWGPGNLGI